MITHHRLIFCTCPDRETALTLARTLIDERLAACVNLVAGITSIYRWKETIQEDGEVLLLIKTLDTRVAALTERLRQLHPYDVPEIIAVPISEGLTEYLNWITTCSTEHE